MSRTPPAAVAPQVASTSRRQAPMERRKSWRRGLARSTWCPASRAGHRLVAESGRAAGRGKTHLLRPREPALRLQPPAGAARLSGGRTRSTAVDTRAAASTATVAAKDNRQAAIVGVAAAEALRGAVANRLDAAEARRLAVALRGAVAEAATAAAGTKEEVVAARAQAAAKATVAGARHAAQPTKEAAGTARGVDHAATQGKQGAPIVGGAHHVPAPRQEAARMRTRRRSSTRRPGPTYGSTKQRVAS